MKLISKPNFKYKWKPIPAWGKKNGFVSGSKKDLTAQNLINTHFGKQMAGLQLRLEMPLKNTSFTSLFLTDPSSGRNSVLEAQTRFTPSEESYTLWFLNYKWENHPGLE